ncbi:hypothetical protein AXG89_31035 (plasmid) [Burkholderia sp. PAMC 26561]|nr:hypothetical protein AXG89_31035 [Burkholderia sp. PAMC 26561]
MSIGGTAMMAAAATMAASSAMLHTAGTAHVVKSEIYIAIKASGGDLRPYSSIFLPEAHLSLECLETALVGEHSNGV